MAGKFVLVESFFAALPVGANRAIWDNTSIGESLYMSIYSFVIALMMVVFPVPGPPDIIETG